MTTSASTCTQSALPSALPRGKHNTWPRKFAGYLLSEEMVAPLALSRAPDGHATVPGALEQQLGVEAHLVPKAWQGAQTYFGEGVVHNFCPGWLKKGKDGK